MKPILLLIIALLSALTFSCSSDKEKQTPNVIIFYADDLGYGDVSSYGAQEISTPNIDRLVNEGLKFTNGYATSATCTPSRFALLTGIYPWRNQKARVLAGNAPLLIPPEQETLADIFKKAGYQTSVIGKWHLGLGSEGMDWNGEISPGPNDLGFDESFILASTNDRSPTVYVEDRFVYGLSADDPLEVNYQKNFEGEPTGHENPEMLKLHPSHGHDMSISNGISRIGYMKGGKSARWIDEHMGDTLLNRAKKFITTNQNTPFFLFYSFPNIHVPRTPHPRFVGKTGMGARGDAIIEIDYAVEHILHLLEELNLDENTLIVFSSDNGPVIDDGYEDQGVELLGDHDPNGSLRGGKYSLFEAGTKVPFVVRWPGAIETGTSDAIISQHDLIASFARMLNVEIGQSDSQELLCTLLGECKSGRKNLILEALRNTCYREGNYLLIPPYRGSEMIEWGPEIESGRSSEHQLYNLESDPGQQDNLASIMPEKLAEMIEHFEAAKRKISLTN